MRFRLLVWLLLFVLGLFIGDRYGLPGWARSATDGGFSAVEGWFGRLGEPIPQAEDGGEAELTETPEAPPAASQPPASADAAPSAPAGERLRINQAGLDIIKESEGLRLEAYNLNGQWLIGYGHSRTAREGMVITEAEAERLLREDVAGTESAVKWIVAVPVNVNQFSALVSLAYNLGTGGFQNTLVVERLNAGDYDGAADAFLRHDRARINGELQSIPHLTERREKERALFLTPA